jgi:hypothetical protein
MRFLGLVLASLLGLVATIQLSGAGEYSLNHRIAETVELRHRSASELVPFLEQFLGDRGTVTVSGERLTINADPDVMVQARKLIADFDIPPRLLLITVVQTADVVEARELIARDARKKAGAHRSTRIGHTSRPDENGASLQVRVLEGRKAFIRLGTTVPGVQLLWVNVKHGQAIPTVGPVMRESGSGFYVQARVTGRKVTLQLYRYADNLSLTQTTGRIREEIGTTVSGNLGQWLDLGGSLELEVASSSAPGYALQRSYEDKTRVLVRVELGS